MRQPILFRRYEAGETVKVLLLARSDNSVKVRKLKFSVCGKERYEDIGYGSRGMVGVGVEVRRVKNMILFSLRTALPS
jgi:hypothetical protein